MDRLDRALHRFWGSPDEAGRLNASPSFASELVEKAGDKLTIRVPRVSKWSFGEQVEHLYLTSHYVLDRLEESIAGKNASRRLGFYGFGLMAGGFIPRGVFRTIPPLEPASGTLDHIVPLQERLKNRLEKLEWNWDDMKANPGRSRHPRMKYMTSSQWIFFADIHHRHHFAILRDILKAAG